MTDTAADIRQAAILLMATDEVLKQHQTLDGALERAKRVAFAVRCDPQHECSALLDKYIQLATVRSQT